LTPKVTVFLLLGTAIWRDHLAKVFSLPSTMTATFLYVFLLCGSALCVYYFLPATWQLPLPPGPKPKFLSGNVHQLPRSEAWKVFQQWSQSFSESRTYIARLSLAVGLTLVKNLPLYFTASSGVKSLSSTLSRRPMTYWTRALIFILIDRWLGCIRN
jgi:hypothetical protein